MTRIPWYRNICWPIFSFILPAHFAAAIGTYFYATMHGFTLSAIIIGVVFLFLTTFGISGGYHRLFAHGTYEAHPILKIFYLVFGAASFEASALKWASDHRRHHAYIDEDQDPYNIKRGFWWAHIGWILTKDPSSQGISKVGDLERDPWIMFQHKYYVPIAFAVGLGLPSLIGWFCGDAWGGFIIGGFLRIVFFYHATFSINSLAHISAPALLGRRLGPGQLVHRVPDDGRRLPQLPPHVLGRLPERRQSLGVRSDEVAPEQLHGGGSGEEPDPHARAGDPEGEAADAGQARRREPEGPPARGREAADRAREAGAHARRLERREGGMGRRARAPEGPLRGLIAALKHDHGENRRKHLEAYATWIEQLRNPTCYLGVGVE
jgi:fatty-acid desaturase